MLAIRESEQKFSLYPPELFGERLLDPQGSLAVQGSLAREGTNRSWWLLHTRSRQEKALAIELRQRRIGYYLPLITRRSLTRGRPRDVVVPLFPSYLFLWGDDEARLAAVKTNRVAATHVVTDGATLWSDLRSIATLIAAGSPLSPEGRLAPGQKVRVKSGAFAGLEGTVLKRHGKTRLVVWVRHVMQGASVEIDDFCLEAM